MNSICISGRLTAEPVVNALPSGKTLLAFSICNNEKSKKSESGEYTPIPQFFECKYWTDNTQHWLKKLYKGTEICISGQLNFDSWEKDGQKRTKVYISIPPMNWPIVVSSSSGKQETNFSEGLRHDDGDIPF